MNVTLFGLGYVGLVSAVSFARLGHHVTGVEVDEDKLDQLRDGKTPINEPQLQEMFEEALAAGRFKLSGEAEAAVLSADVVLVAVGTPSDAAGDVDLGAVQGVCKTIGRVLAEKRTAFLPIVVRSTIPPKAIGDTLVPLLETSSGHAEGSGFAVVANPEFLREGSAIADFFDPFATVLGVTHPEAEERCRQLYDGLEAPVHVVGCEEAFMLKYACNAFHALKVAFANEIGLLSRELDLDSGDVMRLFRQDDRLNVSGAYLRPGFAFGGSCLPKDVRALAAGLGASRPAGPLLQAILESNGHLVSLAQSTIGDLHGGRPVAFVGVAFKAGTDDLRESPFAEVASALAREGLDVRAYDPGVFAKPSTGLNRRLRDGLTESGVRVADDLSQCLEEVGTVVVGHREPGLLEALGDRTGLSVVDLTNDLRLCAWCGTGNHYVALTTGAGRC